MIAERIRRSCARLQCSPVLLAGAVILFIVAVSGAPWAQKHAAALAQAARETAAVLLVLAGYAIVTLTARAVSGRPPPVRRSREGIDLTPLPGSQPAAAQATAAPGSGNDPDLSPAVYPGKRLPAGTEGDRVPETREEVPG